MVKRTLSLCLVAAAFGIAACGGSDDEPAASSAAKSGGGTAVAVADNSFSPADLKVAVGDTVTFENEGQIAHTVTGDDFDSGSMAPSDTFTFEASEVGTFTYVCSFHPGMQGTISVD
jgi:plastocyanin